jgi:hypothetical protein
MAVTMDDVQRLLDQQALEHAKEKAARDARIAAYMAQQEAAAGPMPAPIQIGACCPADAYERDSALGRNTD